MRYILYIFLCLASLLAAEEPERIASSKYYPKLGVTELTLSNGMKVVLRPTDTEDDDICIQILAPRGYASLKKKERSSGRLAAQIAWEGGLGPYNSDQLSSLMYRNGVELLPSINAFSRTIEGSTDAEGLATFLELVHLIFTDNKFDKAALQEVVGNLKRTTANRQLDVELSFEDQYLSLNTQNLNPLKPLSVEELADVDLTLATQVFRSSFSDPSEFVVVMVGHFEIDKVKELIVEQLGSIPKGAGFKQPSQSKAPEFPVGITTKKIATEKQLSSLTRMTFPVKVEINQQTFHVIALMSQIIETRLRNALRHEMESTQGVDVSYEMPLFPSRSPTWITIQFRNDQNKEKLIKNLVLEELSKLQKEGPDDKEIEMVRQNQLRTDEFWLRYNCFWQANLSNYYVWGWDPNGILQDYQESDTLSKSAMRQALQTYISLDNYTVLTAQPGQNP